MGLVDVVVVSYNSRAQLRTSVENLARLPGVEVIVVDNASPDGALEAVADLPIRTLPRSKNAGYARACNEGWRVGSAPFVLFLNPDAAIDEQSLGRLVETLAADERIGAVAPKIVGADGALHHSQRRFPRLRSTYARALFLHRVFHRAAWADEVVRDDRVYEQPGSPEWVSGACMLVRRSTLERLGGLDERFFLYCEDTDLCRRLWDAGLELRFEPRALARHEGGASAPRAALLPLAAASRTIYARKHSGRLVAPVQRLGLALEALTHVVVSHGGAAARSGRVRSFRALLLPESAAELGPRSAERPR